MMRNRSVIILLCFNLDMVLTQFSLSTLQWHKKTMNCHFVTKPLCNIHTFTSVTEYTSSSIIDFYRDVFLSFYVIPQSVACLQDTLGSILEDINHKVVKYLTRKLNNLMTKSQRLCRITNSKTKFLYFLNHLPAHWKDLSKKNHLLSSTALMLHFCASKCHLLTRYIVQQAWAAQSLKTECHDCHQIWRTARFRVGNGCSLWLQYFLSRILLTRFCLYIIMYTKILEVNLFAFAHMYSWIKSGRVLNGELLCTKILEVNLFTFIKACLHV